MCGRFTLRTSDAELSRLFHLVFPEDVRPRFNIAPTQSVLAVRQVEAERKAVWLHWGLIPSWAKDSKLAYSTINARSETLVTKPAFRHAFKRKRCLIIADGFYEWEKVDAKTKVPHRFTLSDGSAFAFAGLWERWAPPSGDVVESCTIVTTTANELVSPYHERMPVILPGAAYEPWLDPTLEDVEALTSLLVPFPAAEMKAETVSSVINNARNDVDPRLSD